jgi:hypothetical protein
MPAPDGSGVQPRSNEYIDLLRQRARGLLPGGAAHVVQETAAIPVLMSS